MGTEFSASPPVLALFQRSVFPAQNGYALRALAWIHALRSCGTPLHVVVFSFQKDTSPAVSAERHHLESLGVVYHHRRLHRFSSALGAVWGSLRGKPLQAGVYSSPNNTRWLHQYVKKHGISTLFSSCARVGGTWLKHPTLRIILDLVDDVPSMYQTALPTMPWGVTRLFYTIEHQRLAKWDAGLRARALDTYYVFPHPEEKTRFVPNGVHQNLPLALWDCPLQEHSPLAYYFLGPTAYGPNRTAADFWHHQVLPSLPNKMHGFFIGEGMDKRYSDSPQITHRGFVEDLSTVLSSVCVCIAPMQSGGGQLNKIIEAMVSQRLVIASPLAMQNITGVKAGETHLECTTPQEYSAALHWVERNKEAAAAIALKGARAISPIYTWDALNACALEISLLNQ